MYTNDAQTVLEGLGFMILTFFMVIGMYLSYSSTKVKYDPNKARSYLLLGAALLLIGLLGSQYLMNLKNELIALARGG